jgi:iron-sulfur cluster assembly protein
MAISLTPAAADRVRHFLAERGHGVGLRLGVRKTGCSGFAYVVNYADSVEPEDRVFESQGVQVLVDTRSVFDGISETSRRHGCSLAESERLGDFLLGRPFVVDALDESIFNFL